MQKSLILCAIFICQLVPRLRAADENWVQEVQKVREQYKDDLELAKKLAAAGKVTASNKLMFGLADKAANPYLDFWIGNNLYRMDPAASYAIHKRMYEAKPEIASFILEWAMERHRKGEYAEAAKLYEDYFKRETDPRMNALLADCYIRTGKLKEAVKAWRDADHPNNHAEIDFAIFEIYGSPHPLKLRGELLQKISAGEIIEIERLIDLDLNFKIDWWNTVTQEVFLSEDMALAEKVLGADSRRFKELRFFVDSADKIEADDGKSAMPAKPAEMELTAEKLRETGLLLGDQGRLPESSAIANTLVLKLLQKDWAPRKELLKRFEQPLLQRAESKDGDELALAVLCCLAVEEQDGRLAKYMLAGWERYGNPVLALGYLNTQLEAKKLSGDDPYLARALAQFPENGPLIRTRLAANGGAKPSLDELVALIKAEFRQLSPRMVRVDSYTLKGLFFFLEERLKDVK